MSMRVRYLIIFVMSFSMTFFLSHIFTDLFLQFLFAVVITGLIWLGQPIGGVKTKDG